jgi:hypothetical protein
MEIALGKEGLGHTHQGDWPEMVECNNCSADCRLGIVLMETDEPKYICEVHENGESGFWPHDAVALAVYFCKNCAKAKILWNQA